MFSGVIHAQSVSVEVSRDSILAENTFSVVYTFEDLDVSDGSSLETIEGLKIVQGPSVMNSVQIINGDRSSKTTYTYIYYAEESGEYKVPAVEVEGKKSESFTLEVYPNPDGIVQEDVSRKDRNGMGSALPFGRMDIDLDDIFPYRRKKEAVKKEAPEKPKRPLKKI